MLSDDQLEAWASAWVNVNNSSNRGCTPEPQKIPSFHIVNINHKRGTES